jgi:hypothetical protein
MLLTVLLPLVNRIDGAAVRMAPSRNTIDSGRIGAIVEPAKCNRSGPGELDIRLGREDIAVGRIDRMREAGACCGFYENVPRDHYEGTRTPDRRGVQRLLQLSPQPPTRHR